MINIKILMFIFVIIVCCNATNSMEQQSKSTLNLQLIKAIKNNEIEKVNELISSGIDVNEDHSYLSLAAEKGYEEIVKILIDANDDVNAKNNWNYTALIWAAFWGRTKIVELLINAGADINAKNNDKNTALMLAKRDNYTDIIILLTNTANNWKNEVYKAIENDDYENFKKYLLKVGTVCFRDKSNNNLLHYTMKSGNLRLTNLIFSIRHDLIAQENNEGETPLSYIGSNGNFFQFFDLIK